MTICPWHEEPIAKHHNREAFDCGDAALNDFLRRHARQTHEQGGAKTFLAVRDDDASLVLGFYSLSPASVGFSRTPAVIKRGLARHDVPVFRLGRLAVDLSEQGKGLGGQLLLSAGRRCLRASQEVGGVALLIDAKNEGVARWYAGYGALPLLDAPLSLLLPLSIIRTVLEVVGKL
jgi:GNAT superfamily N-acetyltransferase